MVLAVRRKGERHILRIEDHIVQRECRDRLHCLYLGVELQIAEIENQRNELETGLVLRLLQYHAPCNAPPSSPSRHPRSVHPHCRGHDREKETGNSTRSIEARPGTSRPSSLSSCASLRIRLCSPPPRLDPR